jgi:hypothetical protein
VPSDPAARRPRAPRPAVGPVRRAGDLLPEVLRGLGVPSARLTRRVREAWDRAADPRWHGDAAPERICGGVLEVGVGSAALRDELIRFHGPRLLEVLRAALPDLPLVALRFIPSASGPPSS